MMLPSGELQAQHTDLVCLTLIKHIVLGCTQELEDSEQETMHIFELLDYVLTNSD